jgi:hypothetical protein
VVIRSEAKIALLILEDLADNKIVSITKITDELGTEDRMFGSGESALSFGE